MNSKASLNSLMTTLLLDRKVPSPQQKLNLSWWRADDQSTARAQSVLRRMRHSLSMIWSSFRQKLIMEKEGRMATQTHQRQSLPLSALQSVLPNGDLSNAPLKQTQWRRLVSFDRISFRFPLSGTGAPCYYIPVHKTPLRLLRWG